MKHPTTNALLLTIAILALNSSIHAHSEPSFLQDYGIRQDLQVTPEKSCKSCPSNSVSLEPEKVIEQTIAAGESHSFSMTLPAGMYSAIELNQKGINLQLTIFAANGQQLRTADLAGIGFSEEISLIAQDATTY